MRLSANGTLPAGEISVVPTGCLALDVATGVGGLPRGRVIEIYGPESSGKTTLALHSIAEAQRLGFTAAIVSDGTEVARTGASRKPGLTLHRVRTVAQALAAAF